jgi:hypothetical protein
MILTAVTLNDRPPFLQTPWLGLVLQCRNCAVRNTSVSFVASYAVFILLI